MNEKTHKTSIIGMTNDSSTTIKARSLAKWAAYPAMGLSATMAHSAPKVHTADKQPTGQDIDYEGRGAHDQQHTRYYQRPITCRLGRLSGYGPRPAGLWPPASKRIPPISSRLGRVSTMKGEAPPMPLCSTAGITSTAIKARSLANRAAYLAMGPPARRPLRPAGPQAPVL